MGLTFTVAPSHIHENEIDGETPEEHTDRLSREKALEVRGQHPESLVIAGDTVVVLEGELLGKPRSPEEAVEMLLALSGNTHTVVSGLALAIPGGDVISGVSATEVTFRAYTRTIARAYVDTGEPMDKAGAYGIQGLGAALVQGIQGDYYTVMGFPIPLLLDLLGEAGWEYVFGKLVPLGGS
jgi:septum formation protein